MARAPGTRSSPRPLTVPVLLRLNSTFDLEMGFFAPDTDARLLADLQEVFAEDPDAAAVTGSELDDLLSRVRPPRGCW